MDAHLRRCNNPWCEGTGKVHFAAFALCPTCWRDGAVIFLTVLVLTVLERWKPWAAWALVAAAFAGGVVWFGVAWRLLSGRRSSLPSAPDE